MFERHPERMPLPMLLRCAGTAISRRLASLAAEQGLSATALRVIEVLAAHDGLSHREIAGHLGVTPATLTPVVDGLEAAGQLRRERDTRDRRVVRLYLTAAGRQRLLTVPTQTAMRLQELLPRPSAEHEKIIRDYLLAVLAAVGRKDGCDRVRR